MRWIAPVVVLAIAFAGWHFFDSRPHAAPTEVVPESADTVSSTPFPAPSVRSPAPMRASSLPSPAVHSAIREQARAVVSAGRNRLVGAYRSEPRSAVWAMQMEQTLTQQSQSPEFASLQANPLDFAVRCRTSTCHITADFASRTAADDWATLYVTNGETGLANTVYDVVVNPDGSVRLELYAHPRS